MKRVRTLLMYASWVVLFFIFSEFLINVSLESSYRAIGRKDSLKQVSVYQAEATRVNGRLKGSIVNTAENRITENYMKVDFYSPRNIHLGSKYFDVSQMEENETKDFEMYFKLEDVSYYEISFTNDKPQGEIDLLPEDLNKSEIVVATIFTLLIFW